MIIPPPPPVTPDWVEIGGIKWAKWNVGATSPEEYGLYFQWGDTQGYTAAQVGEGSGQKYFGWADYKYGDGTSESLYPEMTKYNETDGKTVLDLSDDAANAAYGGNWRMPTYAEWNKLVEDDTTQEWISEYDEELGYDVYKGLLFTDKLDSSKTLFIPAAGVAMQGYLDSEHYYGFGWTRNRNEFTSNAYNCYYNVGDQYSDAEGRYYGFTVRAVLGE